MSVAVLAPAPARQRAVPSVPVPPVAAAVYFRRPVIRPGTVGVVIPAHNEGKQVGLTVSSLWRQTRQPDIVVVVSDNSTDDTITRARSAGATVVQTAGNTHRKAGALNAGIRYLLSGPYFPELVVTLDGDSVFEPHCLERALRIMQAQRDIGGLSVVCQGKRGLVQWPLWATFAQPRLSWWRVRIKAVLAWLWAWVCALCTAALMWAQKGEYARSGFVRFRKNVHTLSGAGSIMRGQAIYDVLDARGELYRTDVRNLVEDFETTLTFKALGWRCANNCYLIAYTDLMPNLLQLFRQRLRWIGGTIYELRRRGWAPETRGSILAMLYGYLGIPLFYVWVGTIVYALRDGAQPRDFWFSACAGLYQAIGLRRLGKWSMLAGFLLVPEGLYMLLRHAWLLLSLVYSYCGLLRKW